MNASCVMISALRRSEPVPFEVELNTVRSCLALEKLRFEEELSVVYDIRSVDFMLPMLTVQPMVENAVKHGICKQPGGGTLEIDSRPGVGTRAVIRIPRREWKEAGV